MKKASLSDKAKFVYGDTAKPLKPNRGLDEKPNRGLEVQAKEIKKASCYLPVDLWLKYKAFELDQAKEGNSISLNSLIVKLLTERLKNY